MCRTFICSQYYIGTFKIIPHNIILYCRDELPEYNDIQLANSIAKIDLMGNEYHIPMKSWGLSVTATNINCIDSIFSSK